MMAMPPPDNDDADNMRTWGMDDNDDSLADAFPLYPFLIAPNAEVEALAHLVQQLMMTPSPTFCNDRQ